MAARRIPADLEPAEPGAVMPSNYATPGVAHLAVAGGLPGEV